MNNWRKKASKLKLIKLFSSIKITVACLALLFVLTLWGTVAQVGQGLYASQERFFYSWYFLASGFIPFPGARLVLWVLFLNLLSVAIVRFSYKRDHLGITLIHTGLLTYFLAAFVTFHATTESNVTLLENEGTNVSQAYRDWELSIWRQSGDNGKDVTAIDSGVLNKGGLIPVEDLGLTLNVKSYFKNAQAYTAADEEGVQIFNPSGIKKLTRLKENAEAEKNIAGVAFDIKTDANLYPVMLYGAENTPLLINTNVGKIYIQLRRKRYPLPFIIKLNEFEMETHPGTQTAKSYKSYVTIEHDNLKRDVLIWMNHPMRFKDYTLYQASYSIDQMGRERSTLAVVKNAGRLLPYIASGIVFSGLAVHFLGMPFRRKQKHV